MGAVLTETKAVETQDKGNGNTRERQRKHKTKAVSHRDHGRELAEHPNVGDGHAAADGVARPVLAYSPAMPML